MRKATLAATFAGAIVASACNSPKQDEAAALARAQERGRLLFDIDYAAWVATDDFRTRVDIGKDETMRGYFVERVPKGLAVTFYAEEGGRLLSAYRADVVDGKVIGHEVFPRGRRAPLTPVQLRLAAVHDVPPGLDFQTCTSGFNVTPIPPASPEAPMEVYFLSPRVEDDEFPLGGHFSATLSREGKLLTSRRFSNACLNLPVRPNVAFFSVSHVLDPVPTEIHVFTALYTGKPVRVITGDRVWNVDGKTITLDRER